MSDLPDLQTRLGAAIDGVFAKEAISSETAPIVTGWAVIVETSEIDGSAFLTTVHSRGQAVWKTLGMVEHYAHIVRNRIELEPSDDD